MTAGTRLQEERLHPEVDLALARKIVLDGLAGLRGEGVSLWLAGEGRGRPCIGHRHRYLAARKYPTWGICADS